MSLADSAEREHIRVAVRVWCFVQEDDGLSREDPVPVFVESKDLNGGGKRDGDGSLVFDLKRDEAPLFTFKSDPYAKDWSTSVRVEVKEVT